jgi:Zn-dependent peptidase ImmA (M78 family)/DNA-binding XRE family transcriptional regulator
MSTRGPDALVTPALLAWARETAGFSLGEAARRAGFSPEKMLAWEDGRARPTMNQARRLAELYHRTLGTFYLATPPEEPAPPADYRRRDRRADYSPELRWQLKRAAALRATAVELAGEEGDPFPTVDLAIRLTEPPHTAAHRIRRWLGIPDGARPWREAADAFRFWRRQIEAKGILIFIVRGIDPDEMSGFTLAADAAPVLAINGGEGVERRLFTLLHELTHALLRQGGVSDLHEEDGDPESMIERFCNAVAARVLLPDQELLGHEIVEKGGREASRLWLDADLAVLARDFGVSREVVYRRLVDLELARREDYLRWRSRLTAPRRVADETDRKGGPDFYRLKIHDLGLSYLRRVFDAYQARIITLADVCDYVGVKADVARKLESRFSEEMLKASPTSAQASASS